MGMINMISKNWDYMVSYIYRELYLFGYKKHSLPRTLRCLFAKTKLHRSWLSGSMGVYCENGQRRGVKSRAWYTRRK